MRMGDGPPANLPDDLDAYAGYVDLSGIGVTFPAIEAAFPNAHHLSISVHGVTAMCGDVENGALSSWAGYKVGYCSVSRVNELIGLYGRPPKLWTAHVDPALGAHICSPACWPGLVTTADGTQWSNHGGAWDESVLAATFFDFLAAPTPPPGPPILYPGDDMKVTSASVIISGGHGWLQLPAGITESQVVNVTVVTNDPVGTDSFGVFPTFTGVTNDGTHRAVFGPGGAGSAPDGAYGVLVWSVTS